MSNKFDFIEWAKTRGNGKKQIPMDIMFLILDFEEYVNSEFKNLNIHSVSVSFCPNCGCGNPKKTYDGYWCKMCKTEFQGNMNGNGLANLIFKTYLKI